MSGAHCVLANERQPLKTQGFASNGRRTIGFEIKTSSVPTVTKRFWVAIDDLKLDAAFVVAPIAAVSGDAGRGRHRRGRHRAALAGL